VPPEPPADDRSSEAHSPQFEALLEARRAQSHAGGSARAGDGDRQESVAQSLLDARERADRAVGLDQAARLLEARRRALGEADERLREIDERAVLAELADAGRGLQQSLESITADAAFWDRLEAAEGALDRATRSDLLRLREVVEHDLVQVLPHWGFRPPPSEVEFAGRIQLSLGDLFAMRRGDPLASHRIDRARTELSWFLLRLRRVLDESEAVAGATRTKGPQDRASARVRAAAWVRRAAEAAGPAAVAAGAVATVAGPQAGIAAGAAAAGKEGLKQLVQLGAADAMGQVLSSGGLPEPGRLAEDLEKAVDTAMRRLAGVATLEPGAPAREAAVFLVRRELYRVLQHGPEQDDLGPLQDYCEKTLHLLRDPDLATALGFWDTGRPPDGRGS
jgi:hypothetical protein